MGPAVLKKRSMRVPVRHVPEGKTILLNWDRGHPENQAHSVPAAVALRAVRTAPTILRIGSALAAMILFQGVLRATLRASHEGVQASRMYCRIEIRDFA
jgi:hypothetical protein